MRNVAHAAGATPVPLSLHRPPPSPTSAIACSKAVSHARARLTLSALRSIIGYLSCNATAAVGNIANSSNGGPRACVGGAAPGRLACSPLIMADALFAAAAQAPSASAATAADSGAPSTPPVPVTVTRPLAFVAASPLSRRGLEQHLTGGCALPPLGSLVLQVQSHRPLPATPAHLSRVSAQHASRRRVASPAQVRAVHPRDETLPAVPLPLLLVSSTNVANTTLPFQPSRSPSTSPVAQPQTAAAATLALRNASRWRPPPAMPLTSSTLLPPATAVVHKDNSGRRSSSVCAKPPSQQQLLPSPSTVLMSCRLPVVSAAPSIDRSPASLAPVARTCAAPASASCRSLNTASPTSMAQGAFGGAAVGVDSKGAFALGAREGPTTCTGVFGGASPSLRPAHATPSQGPPPPAPLPSSTSAALQTLCHAVWWVLRDSLPVSLSLLGYREAGMEAVWAMLSGAPPPLPQEAGLVVVDEGTGQRPPPLMCGRHAQAARTLGEPRRSDGPPLPKEGDGVRGDSHTAAVHNFRAPAGAPDRDLVADAIDVAVVTAPVKGATGAAALSGITEVTRATTPFSSHMCHACHSLDFHPASVHPMSPPKALGEETEAAHDSDNDGTLNRRLTTRADIVLPPPSAPSGPLTLTHRSSVEQLHVHGKAADAALTALLPAHPEVRSLRLTHGALSDAQLRHLARICPGVTHLSLAMNSRIQTTAFLCPPLSDTSSVSTSVATATTAATSRMVATASPNQDLLHQRGAHHTDASAIYTAVLTSSSQSSPAAFATRGAGGDASHPWMSNLWRGAAAASASAASLGVRSEGSHGADVSSAQSPSSLPHSLRSSCRNSQLDLFAPDEEGEPEMRMSLWQAAQADTAERRQPVFILRPQDVVLGRATGAAGEDADGPGASTTDSGRGAAASAVATTSPLAVQGSTTIEQWTLSRRRSSPYAETPFIEGASASPIFAHASRRTASGAPLLTAGAKASSADAFDTVISARQLPSVAHTSASATASVRNHTDPRRSLPPRPSNASCPETLVSPLQPSTLASTFSLSAPCAVAATAADEAGSRTASPAKAIHERALTVPGPPVPDAPAHPTLFSGDGVRQPAVAHASRRGSRERRHHREGHGGSSSRLRPTYWADTLVDLDLSYTQVCDDAARDLPQLRRLQRLSLEGCMRLSQVSWLPLLLHLRELNLSLSSVQGRALHPLGRCPRLAWLKLEGCSSFTAIHQLWCREMDAADARVGGDGGGSTVAAASVVAPSALVARYTTIGGIPAITVLTLPAGAITVPATAASPRAAPGPTASPSTRVRAAAAAGAAEEADGYGEGSAAAAAAADDEAIAAESAEPAPLLSELRVLIATSTGLTDAGLHSLSRMVGLDCLLLDRCPGVTDVSVAATLPSLHTLDASRTRVTAEGLAGLRLSRTLKQLRLQECPALSRLPVLLVEPVSRESARAGGADGDESSGPRRPTATAAGSTSHPLLHRPCPPLTVLDFSNTRQLTADGLSGLVANEATVTAQAAAAAVAEQLAGREVDRGNDDVDTGDVDFAAAVDEPLSPASIFPHVRHVLLRSCDAVTDLRPLRGFINVIELDLYHTNITEAALTSALVSWTCLEVLNIASTRVRSLAAWCPYSPSEAVGAAVAVARRGRDGEAAEGDGDLDAQLPRLPWQGRLPAFAATLRVLVLSNTTVTAAGLEALTLFPQLEVLQLSNCRRLVSLRFLALAAGGAARRSALGELTVTEAAHLTNTEAFPYIACCPALRFLSLVGCVQLGRSGNSRAALCRQHEHVALPTDDDVGVLGRLRGLAELNLSNTGVDLSGLKTMLCAATSPGSRTATAPQRQELYRRVSLSLQRLWLRGCRHLDEDALMSTAVDAMEHRERQCDGSGGGGGGPTTSRLLPLLREVYLSHGKYGAAVLSGLLD
ncbi:hypothetical protein JIQ42_07745 [Leishmania sp. Namibia]|uniref:hypothetical protein n=1 Tax=Leishmania sp. Namibia TaxID=2802991 RepID=UPI001B41300C|nr:hypothetical protein JIQ42_07745 [Leishmania sp. Namibia]